MDEQPELVIKGTVRGGGGLDIDLTVAMEPVVSDDVAPELIALYTTTIRADNDGHFDHRHAVTKDVADQLHGWAMCTVMVQPRAAGVRPFTKTIRWQRRSAAELITGFNALLESLSFELDTTQVSNGCAVPLAATRTPRQSSARNGLWNPR
jgi:hypothetical protein